VLALFVRNTRRPAPAEVDVAMREWDTAQVAPSAGT
jgi:hypothetical protein